MLFEDTTMLSTSFAKDPCVVELNGAFFMYYSHATYDAATSERSLAIGIARSDDLEHWDIQGHLKAEQAAEGKGVGAPGAIVLDGVVHLFYQSYGQFPRDFICHATSTDGLSFTRDPSNPIVQPTGSWNNGRAIDADVVAFKGELFLYWATRDPKGEIQMLGVSSAPLTSDFSQPYWVQRCEESILAPELPWEQACIEAPATLSRDGRVYLFYAGAYNCSPQQISCAISDDGVHFTRVSDQPLLAPGPAGSWNASESGHPYVFEWQGQTHLFYQGSPDNGKTWRLSRTLVEFDANGMPVIDAEA